MPLHQKWQNIPRVVRLIAAMYHRLEVSPGLVVAITDTDILATPMSHMHVYVSGRFPEILIRTCIK